MSSDEAHLLLIMFSHFHRFLLAKDVYLYLLLGVKVILGNLINSREPSLHQHYFLLPVLLPMNRDLWNTVSTFQRFGAASENRRVGVHCVGSM